MTKSVQKIDNLEIEGLINSLKENQLDADQVIVLQEILSVFSNICSSLQEKRMSIQRLKNMLGIKTEKKESTRGISNSSKKKAKNQTKSQIKNQTIAKIQQMIYQK